MSKTTSWAHSLGDSYNVAPVKRLDFSNFSRDNTNAKSVVLIDQSSPLDLKTRVTIRRQNIDRPSQFKSLPNPPSTGQYIEYGVTVDAVRQTVDSEDASYEVDDAAIVAISFKQRLSNTTDATAMADLLAYALGAVYNVTSSGTISGNNIDEFQRGLYDPT